MHIVLLLWKQVNSTKKEGQKRGRGKGQMVIMRKKDEVKYEEMIFCNLIFFIVIL
jgi:hypothetical protein